MDIVAAQGLLAETCLLQLSTASRGTLTGAARHKAKKGLMSVQKNGRAEADGAYQFDHAERDRLLADYRVDRQMIQRALAAIALCNSLGDARETAGVALQRSVGRRLSLQEVTQWAQDHVWHF